MGVEQGADDVKPATTAPTSHLVTPRCEDSTRSNRAESLEESNINEKLIWGAKRLRSSGTDIQLARVPSSHTYCLGGPSSSGAAETVSAAPDPSSRTLQYQQSTSSLEACDGKEKIPVISHQEREVKSEEETSTGGLDSTGTVPTAAHLLMSLCKAVPHVDRSVETKSGGKIVEECETAQSPRTLPARNTGDQGAGHLKARDKEERINIAFPPPKHSEGSDKPAKKESKPSDTQQKEESRPSVHHRKQNGKPSGYQYRFGPGNSVNMQTTVNGRQKSCAYVGVRKRQWGTYAAEIRNQLTGSREWLGTFDSAEEAAVVYDMRLRQIKGPGAKCNFPPLSLTGRMVKREICPHGKSAPQRLTLMIPEDWLQQVGALQSGTLRTSINADVSRTEISSVAEKTIVNESSACAVNNIESMTTTLDNGLSGYEIRNNESNNSQ